VVFVARQLRAWRGNPQGHGLAREDKLVGVDWMNRHLGGRPEYDGGRYAHEWELGKNVLVSTAPDELADDTVDMAIADSWRRLELLREWAVDGVVLSNDTKDCYNGNHHDGQLFNICVQGPAAVNNGFGTPTTLHLCPRLVFSLALFAHSNLVPPPRHSQSISMVAVWRQMLERGMQVLDRSP
jgi:hypothetical protein